MVHNVAQGSARPVSREMWACEIPTAPGAWLTTTARNRALDVLRRRQTERAKLAEVAMLADPGDDGGADDDQLRLIFTCCHPALALDGRVALTLKTVAGLSMAEIARAFLVSDATPSQRLLRTKRKITNAGIPYRVPPDELLAERLDGVLAVLYLIYNEGYGRSAARLAGEAIRLARLLVDLMPAEDEARGLLALMLDQESRRAAGSTRAATWSRSRTRTAEPGTGRSSTRRVGCCATPPVPSAPIACRPRSRTATRPRPTPTPPPGRGSCRSTTRCW